ncbi:two component transcriptional regulator, winged helix family [Bacteroides coprosuis DSM 18011]|uniref:Two component transcriptional regulator, winged helix family n=1 Tax=Bacteroides coprosuis DSM 18011 TaxID=679937 RepID=F3ZPU9_9BACE|nr:response regulator transcription factor [Bacteroides coprosuis]EGJ71686.1 two component transcriptional regulator, winged helix family [Bacteroides coprosuis DSM 18011]
MKILIIEDEKTLSDNMMRYLTANNYRCEQAFTYEEGLEKISLYSYSCILLDLNLPDGDGMHLLEEIRNNKIDSGVIIISARGALDDKIRGLMTGADDYLAKPFSLPELSVRIYALLRRRLGTTSTNTLESNGIVIDLLGKTAKVNGESLNLTKTEYNLLLFLIANKNRVISKNAIAEHLSGDMADMFNSHNFIYTHIKNLKAKLAQYNVDSSIRTVYGTGYQWAE